MMYGSSILELSCDLQNIQRFWYMKVVYVVPKYFKASRFHIATTLLNWYFLSGAYLHKGSADIPGFIMVVIFGRVL